MFCVGLELGLTGSLPQKEQRLVDDFFALIRACYNQRAHRSDYHRLTFVLFGVATPSDLVQDRHKTPFNIGKAINLQGFQVQEAQALAQGLVDRVNQPQAVLAAILSWTDGQPFLTQKLCSLVQMLPREGGGGPLAIEPGDEAFWVERLVRSHLITDWETQDEPEHLRTIRDRIERNGHRTARMFALYQQTLRPLSPVPVDDSREQTELLLSGLVRKQQGVLKVNNRLYAEVFNLDWVTAKLELLRPYSQALDAWVASEKQDESRLLRGQALRDAASWSRGKSLSDLDYQFMASSEALDRREAQQALELERAKEITARQSEEKKNSRLQKSLLGLMGLALVGLTGFSLVIRQQNRALALREVEAITATSEALLSADKDLDALVAAIQATRNLQAFNSSKPESVIAQQVNTALRRAVYRTSQYNTFSGHGGTIRTLAFSPDGNAIASASVDNTAKLWKPDGTLITTLTGHSAPLVTVDFSADGERLLTTSEDNTVKLWQRDGTLITTLVGHTGPVWCADFSPDGQTIVTGSGDKTLKLWRPDGTLITTFAEQPSAVFEAEFSPDGQAIATANASDTVEMWTLDGTLLTSLGKQESRVSALEFSAAGQYLATASVNGTVKLWDTQRNTQGNTKENTQNKLLNTITAHAGEIAGLDVSPDGQQLVSSSDKTVKRWQRDGTLLNTYAGHGAHVYDVRFSPDGKTLASAGFDALVRLWRVDHPLVTPLNGHRSAVVDVDFSPDGQMLATSSTDNTVKLWRRNGQLLKTILEHSATVQKAIFSPDGKLLATASEDGVIKIWQLGNSSNNNSENSGPSHTLITNLEGKQGGIWGAAFSPDSKLLATSSIDSSVKLWKPDGTLVRTLKGHTAPVWTVTFSADGEQIATASSDNQVKIWRRDGTEIVTLTGEGAPFFGVAFSPDGKTLATTSSDTSVVLWPIDELAKRPADGQGQAIDGKTMQSTQLTGHTAPVFDVEYSPNGQIIATVSGDNTLRLWGADGTTRTILEKHNASVGDLTFSPDGRMIATTSDDKTALLWDVEQALTLDLLAYSCDWVRD
ncbi:MAG: AAA-like domain-containing protein, partial [Cyanobacteria bacterium J06649_4]